MMTSSGRGCTTSPGSTRSTPEARASIFCAAVCPPDGLAVAMLRLLLLFQHLQGVYRDVFCVLVVENDGGTRRFGTAIPDGDKECTHLFDAFRRTAGDHQRR